jgi:hypothetical protein
MTLAEFLLARIAEDEVTARSTPSGNPGNYSTITVNGVTTHQEGAMYWYAEEDGNGWAISAGFTEEDADTCVTCNDSGGNELVEEDVRHMVRWDPARVLAECEAKRRIVNTYAKLVDNPEHQRITSKGSVDYSDTGLVIDYLFDDVLQQLAQVYADHPDYQQEWTA